MKKGPRNEPVVPTVKYWLLREELQKRQISLINFANALGVTPGVLSGTSSAFPMDKLEKVVELLNNWDGPRRPKVKNVRLVQASPVTKDMLVTGRQ